MKIIKAILLTIVAISVLIGGVFVVWPKPDFTPDPPSELTIDSIPSPFLTTQPDSSPLPTNNSIDTEEQTTYLHQPTTNFKERVTKKPFGIYVTPDNSPVSPERFTGWHTGADAEYDDITEEVLVFSISDGIVRSARRTNDYGGIVVIEHTINDKSLLAIYGHLNPASLVPVNTSVTVGQEIGILGDGNTDETDGERKHLHFGLLNTTKLNVQGYVDSSTKLNNWLDPLTLF